LRRIAQVANMNCSFVKLEFSGIVLPYWPSSVGVEMRSLLAVGSAGAVRARERARTKRRPS
jgi:hypothetical protein